MCPSHAAIHVDFDEFNRDGRIKRINLQYQINNANVIVFVAGNNVFFYAFPGFTCTRVVPEFPTVALLKNPVKHPFLQWKKNDFTKKNPRILIMPESLGRARGDVLSYYAAS